MKLTGELGGFSLADVLGLFILDGRSGAVCLNGSERRGAVWVTGGAIAGASCDLSRALLVRAIAAGTELTEDQVRVALSCPQPARALMVNAALDPTVVQGVAGEQTLDCLALMLGWREGTFEVLPDADVPDDVGLRLPIAAAVASAASRGAHWAALRQALPPDDAVLTLRPDSAGDRVITPQQWRLLCGIDGRRTTAEVLARAGAPLAAATALVDLLSAGLVTSTTQPAAPAWPGVAAVIAQYERGLTLLDLPQPRSARSDAAATPAPEIGGRAARRRASHAAVGYPGDDRAANTPLTDPRVGRAGVVVDGATAMQPAADPAVDGLSRSLLMQLIAGVRGL